MNLIDQVLKLDAEATKGDWYEHANGSSVWTTHMLDQETKPSLCVANVHGRSDEEMVDNCLLIALYRTAAPKLAKAVDRVKARISEAAKADEPPTEEDLALWLAEIEKEIAT